MLKLAVTVVAIALPDWINPTLIGGELFVASGSRPRHQTAAFTLAALTVTFVFGLAFALGLGDLILRRCPNPARPSNMPSSPRPDRCSRSAEWWS
jgi:hypothetical protein